MGARCHRFSVGAAACAVLLDGAAVIGAAGIAKRFPAATEADYRRAYAEIGLALDGAVSSFNILVARLGAETVLVDAGEGGRPKGGQVVESLRLADISPQEITRVVITHTHGDHILGLLDADDAPTFPNATYIISTTEMAAWESRLATSAAAQRPIATMMAARGLRRIEMDAPIVPGMRALPLPGHTPGQIGVVIESAGERLHHLADLLHSPMQFAHPEWSPTFDADISRSVPTRRAALGQAADDGVLVLFYHLPFPGLGRVRRVGERFGWTPLPSPPDERP